MKNVGAHILLFLFSAFLVCIAVDYSGYLEVISGGAAVEDVNTNTPEEPHENHKDAQSKSLFAVQHALELHFCFSGFTQTKAHQFSVKENPYLAVPYSPPEML